MSVIHGKDFLNWLAKAGVIPAQTRRVVIDASVQSAVMIYAEMYGSADLISVDAGQVFGGARVHVLGGAGLPTPDEPNPPRCPHCRSNLLVTKRLDGLWLCGQCSYAWKVDPCASS